LSLANCDEQAAVGSIVRHLVLRDGEATPIQVFGVGTIDPRGFGAILVPLQRRMACAQIYAPLGRLEAMRSC
jgi:hypothetical protein